MDFFTMAFTLLNGVEPGPLLEKIILFLTAFFLVRKEMRKQFHDLQEAIAKVGIEVKNVGDKLEQTEINHGTRINILEVHVRDLMKMIYSKEISNKND